MKIIRHKPVIFTIVSVLFLAISLFNITTCLNLKNTSKTSTQYIVNDNNTGNNSGSVSAVEGEENDVIENNEDTDSFMNSEDSDVESNSSSNESNNEENQLIEKSQENHIDNQSTADSDLVDSPNNDNNDNFAKRNNNNMTNFVELNPKLKKKGIKGPLPIMNNQNYAYSADNNQKNEIQKAINIAHTNKLANELLKRKVNVSIPERIESSFKKYRSKHGETQDDFTAFLGYLKDASERANIKMSLRKKSLEVGFIPQKIKRG